MFFSPVLVLFLHQYALPSLHIQTREAYGIFVRSIIQYRQPFHVAVLWIFKQTLIFLKRCGCGLLWTVYWNRRLHCDVAIYELLWFHDLCTDMNEPYRNATQQHVLTIIAGPQSIDYACDISAISFILVRNKSLVLLSTIFCGYSPQRIEHIFGPSAFDPLIVLAAW